MQRNEVRVAQFDALDGSGKVHRIIVRTTFTRVLTAVGWGMLKGPGLSSYYTTNGMVVSRLDKGRYEIVGTGIRLHSESPDAP